MTAMKRIEEIKAQHELMSKKARTRVENPDLDYMIAAFEKMRDIALKARTKGEPNYGYAEALMDREFEEAMKGVKL